MHKIRSVIGPAAHDQLLRAVNRGNARPGHDLYDGRRLPAESLSRGHYMSRANFQRALDSMNARPDCCHWCRRPLPRSLARLHQQPHDHREEIRHHFHPECWHARLLAIAAIFGHIRLDPLLRCPDGQRSRVTVRETVMLVVKKVWVAKRFLPKRPWRARP